MMFLRRRRSAPSTLWPNRSPRLRAARFPLALALVARLAAGASAEITWTAPSDGGTPRQPGRIERQGPSEFLIRASFEEGGTSVLRHAVSRVDLVCRNSADRPQSVTVHLDLSGDGQRTDFAGRPEAGMNLRDFVFVQPPGQPWRQVDGTTRGWIATAQFIAPPGETRLGLSPWYTYQDYLRFVGGLPDHPHLARRLLGRSDGGREHWELTVSDPGTPPDGKRRVFWHAREHAYETYSSFAMEGLVEFLLSPSAAELRRRYTVTLHPMTNVDGVAQGFEYRGGYDHPDPRGTTTGRLTFQAVDRLQPHFAVAWHNWIAPRDRNVVFFTDQEGGRPSDRGWLRFSQLFPSLRAAGHRWRDETNPGRFNWHGRQPLSEANLHQYAMRRYGTRVWGWEMPWWNCSVAEARASGASFARAWIATLDEIEAGRVPAPRQRPGFTVARWEPHEFQVHGAAAVENPYRDAVLVGQFTAPSGMQRVVDGFFDGGDTWRLRFAPDEPGDWSYQLRGEGVQILERGQFRCTAALGHGPIGIHPANPYAFAHADGSPFFPMGDTCYGLFDDSPITPELRQQYLRARRSQQFNFVRMSVGHSEAQAASDASYWAWGGTFQAPDLDRFNPEFFRRFDELMTQLRACGMNVELILLNYYRRPLTDTAAWTPARERQWIRYLTARYGALDNVFLWTVANEYETHPDGSYRLDDPADVNWARATARWIKAGDPHRHLVTVHPVISASRRGDTPRAPFDPPWRIGEFFGEEPAIDVLSQQTGQSEAGAAWSEALQCWTGDSATLAASLAADRRYRKPVLNSENGYEYLRGHPTGKRQVHHTDKVRRSAWRIVCAGGYFAAGFHGTIGHSDAWNRLDSAHRGRYSFVVQDQGAAAQLAALYRFFTALPYWRMQPFAGVKDPCLALAEEGRVYVVFAPRGGKVSLDLSSARGQFAARWFNPRTGEYLDGPRVEGAAWRDFFAPDQSDWTLLLTAREAANER